MTDRWIVSIFYCVYSGSASATSELGGFIGLLLGASVLTVFEIIDLFVYNAFAKYCCRPPKKNK